MVETIPAGDIFLMQIIAQMIFPSLSTSKSCVLPLNTGLISRTISPAGFAFGGSNLPSGVILRIRNFFVNDK
jgi:hypothetical protein